MPGILIFIISLLIPMLYFRFIFFAMPVYYENPRLRIKGLMSIKTIISRDPDL